MTTMNPEKMTAPIVAIYDLMMDGQWHENSALIAYGATICIDTERDAALHNGRRVRRTALASGTTVSDDVLIVSGAKDIVRNRLMIAVRGGRLERDQSQHRMTDPARAAWHTARGSALSAPTRRALTAVPTPASADAPVAAEQALDPKTTSTYMSNRAPNVFGGIAEDQGWLDAPRRLMSRVHFRIKNDILPLDDFRAALPAGSVTTYDEGTGLYRVDVEHGTGDQIHAFITGWCADHGYETKGLRVQHDMRRRVIGDLDPAYLADLCSFYHRYCRGPVRKHASTLKVHFADKDDESQQVFEWILEGVAAYDEQSGVPFGAFLVQKLHGWVHDLNRAKYGRHISEQEMRQQRARQDFTSEHGHAPSERQLAEILGQDIAVFRDKANDVSNLRGIRNAGALTMGEDGEAEVPLPDDFRTPDRYEDAMRQSLISQVMTKACSVDTTARGKLSKNPNVLGWVTWYETTWHNKSKVTLASELGTSTRNMSQYSDRAQERMRGLAADLVDH